MPIRLAESCSEAERDGHSGVNLRSIFMHEQHNKDINEADIKSVYHMAKVLVCTIEGLIEDPFNTAKPMLSAPVF